MGRGDPWKEHINSRNTCEKEVMHMANLAQRNRTRSPRSPRHFDKIDDGRSGVSHRETLCGSKKKLQPSSCTLSCAEKHGSQQRLRTKILSGLPSMKWVTESVQAEIPQQKTGRFGDGPPGVRGEQATMAGVLGARRATAGHGHLEGRAAAAGHGVRADRGLCRACLRVGLLRICFGSVQGFF